MSSNNENENPNGHRISTSSNGSGHSRTNSPVKTSAQGANQHRQQLHTIIPLSRVKTIMKSSPDIHNINPDTLYIVCKATELFVQTFAKEAVKRSNKDANLDYEKLANLVAKDDRFQFLTEIVPFKMKAKDALKQIEADKRVKQ